MLRKWKYNDADIRPLASYGAACYDCGLSYDGGCGWCDVTVPNEIWELINPTYYPGAGLLCFNCMARRLAFIGLRDVPVFICSGPFKINEPTEKEVKKYFQGYGEK